MPTALFVLALVGLVLLANARRPLRFEAVSVPSFFAGWLTGELALQHLVWTAGLTAGLCASGALSGWAGWSGLALAVVDWAGLAYLAFVGHRTGKVVARALEQAKDGPFVAVPEPPRAQWFSWWRLALALPLRSAAIERVKGIDYWGDGIGRHRLDVLRSSRRPPRGAPVLIQIHGGAWMMGDKREQGIPLMHELVERGWVCVAINYRLAPRATWPAEIVDCKRAIAWVKEHIADYGGDPSFVAVTGGSAGGHLSALAALTANDATWQPGFEDADTSVQACVPFYGVFDMTGSLGSPRLYGHGLVMMLERMVMKTDLATHREVFEQASPTARIHAGAPPFMVFHGRNDTLVPVEVARRFVADLSSASRAPVAFAELPLAQHAFDVLVSPRCWATSAGAVAFLEQVRRDAASAPRSTPSEEMADRREGAVGPTASASDGPSEPVTDGHSEPVPAGPSQPAAAGLEVPPEPPGADGGPTLPQTSGGISPRPT